MSGVAADLIAARRNEGLRITRSRRAICEVLADNPEAHLSAAQIQVAAQERIGSSINESTVYRTLDTLEARGYRYHIHPGHAPGVIHLADGAEHHHLVCENCGRIVDVPLGELEPLVGTVLGRREFRLSAATDPGLDRLGEGAFGLLQVACM